MLCCIAGDIKAFALAGRHAAYVADTRGVATLCPGLRARCPFRALSVFFYRTRIHLRCAGVFSDSARYPVFMSGSYFSVHDA